MARRQSYRTRQADPEEPRYAPKGSGAPSPMLAALVIVVVVAALAGGAMLLTNSVGADTASGAPDHPAKADGGDGAYQAFQNNPPPSDEPFRKTWGNSAASGRGGASTTVPDNLSSHGDWEEAMRLEREGLAFLATANSLREAGDLSWRKPARDALERFRGALDTTAPWVSVLESQYGAGDPHVRAFMRKREDWLEKQQALGRML